MTTKKLHRALLSTLKTVGPNYRKIADSLSLEYWDVYNAFQDNDDLSRSFDTARQEYVDLAEDVLKEALLAKNVKVAMFVARTLGKDRGYSIRDEVSGPNGGAIRFAVGPDLESMSDDQLKSYYAALAKNASHSVDRPDDADQQRDRA